MSTQIEQCTSTSKSPFLSSISFGSGTDCSSKWSQEPSPVRQHVEQQLGVLDNRTFCSPVGTSTKAFRMPNSLLRNLRTLAVHKAAQFMNDDVEFHPKRSSLAGCAHLIEATVGVGEKGWPRADCGGLDMWAFAALRWAKG